MGMCLSESAKAQEKAETDNDYGSSAKLVFHVCSVHPGYSLAFTSSAKRIDDGPQA
jgi:hypothetical protein